MKHLKVVLMGIMVLLMFVVTGCGTKSEEDVFVGKWIMQNPSSYPPVNLIVLDIQKKDKNFQIKKDVYYYDEQKTKDERLIFTNDVHLEFLNTLNMKPYEIQANLTNKELYTENGKYIYNEKDDTLTYDKSIYARYKNEDQFKEKIQELKQKKEEEIKNRTKNASMFKYYYDKFEFDDSILNK